MQYIGKELSYEKSFDICGTCRFLPNGIRYHRGRRTGAVSSGYDHAAFYSKMHIFCTARSPAEPFHQTYRC